MKPKFLHSDKLQSVEIRNPNKFRIKIEQDPEVANELIKHGHKTIDTFWLAPNESATLVHNYVIYKTENTELFSVVTKYLSFDLK